jgi:hypothetical protein
MRISLDGCVRRLLASHRKGSRRRLNSRRNRPAPFKHRLYFERCEDRTLLAVDALTGGVMVAEQVDVPLNTAAAAEFDQSSLDAEGEGSGSGSACDYYPPASVTINPVSDVYEGGGEIGAGSGSGSGSGIPVVAMSGAASNGIGYVAIYVEGDLVGHASVIDGGWHTEYPYSFPTADDNPSGTASDLKHVEVIGGPAPECTATAGATFTIHNAPPGIWLTDPSPSANEGNSTPFTFNLYDAGVFDLFTVEVDWGDGQTETLYPSQGEFTLYHTYSDDDPTATPQDEYLITATATDDDTGEFTYTTPVTVHNVAPTVTLDPIPAVDEGQPLTITGQVSDPGLEDDHLLELAADLNFDGDTNDSGETVTHLVEANGSAIRTFSFTTLIVPDDGATYDLAGAHTWGNETSQDPLLITVTAEDDDTSTGGICALATVRNVAPQFVDDPEDPDDEPTVEFEFDEEDKLVSAAITGSFNDVGLQDYHRISIEWGEGGAGDGASNPIHLPLGDRSFSITRPFDPAQDIDPGSLMPIEIALEDDDLGVVFVHLVDPKPNLTIHNGQGGAAIPEAREVVDGAFTVANLNDTDGDGTDASGNYTPDKDDNLVVATEKGEDEQDLMRLVLHRPVPDNGGNVTLKVTAGNAKLWEKSTKENHIALIDGQVTFPTSQLDKTIWVELPAVSEQVGDVRLEMHYGSRFDKVVATGIWVTRTAVEYETKTANDVLAHPTWQDMTTPPKDLLETHGGTGIRPITPTNGGRNVIAFQYTVAPPNVGQYPNIKIDITRRKEGVVWFYEADGEANLEYSDFAPPRFPKKVDEANDDSGNEDNQIDETDEPNENDHMYSIDPPGLNAFLRPDAAIVTFVQQGNLEEFVRVSVKNADPEGNSLQGSRASDKTEWHVRHRFNWVDGQWVRTTGVGDNDIGLGHVVIDFPEDL